MNCDIYKSEFGTLLIKEDGFAITSISLIENELTNKDIYHETDLTKKAKQQLEEYFQGKRKVFTLPLNPSGTNFQKKVWGSLCQIPYGETFSYQQIATAIHCPKGYRAVGHANHKNPIIIMIPCHRVIGKNGSLVGYAWGLEMKQNLLNLEKKNL